MDELNYTISSEHLHSKLLLNCTNQAIPVRGIPKDSILKELNTTHDVFNELYGNTSYSNNIIFNTSIKDTCTVNASFNFSTSHFEVLNETDANNDMDISYARIPMKVPTKSLTTIGEDQDLEKKVSIDEIITRSEEIKRIYAKQLYALESINTNNQENNLSDEKFKLSNDTSIYEWNQSGSIKKSKTIENLNKRHLILSSNNNIVKDVQNDTKISMVSLKKIKNSSTNFDSTINYDKIRISEDIMFISPITSIDYKENYKKCDEKYQLGLAIAFIQSIMYNESLRHPMLKDYVNGFEDFSYLKSHMVKTEVLPDFDDLFEKIVVLRNIDIIIDEIRRINMDVYKSTTHRLKVFFDKLYKIYFMLLDHVFLFKKKLLEHNDEIIVKCSNLLNEITIEKKLYNEDVDSIREITKPIISKYNL